MLICKVLTVLQVLVLFAARAPARHVDQGWLYRPDGPANIVRFTVVFDDPSDPRAFVPVRATGYIILGRDDFTMSIAELFGTSLTKYEHGVLSKSISGEPNMIHAERGVRMSYDQGLESSLDDLRCAGLGACCRKLLNDTTVRKRTQTLRISPGSWPVEEMVVGPGRGALRKYTARRPLVQPPSDRRAVVTFSVIGSGEEETEEPASRKPRPGGGVSAVWLGQNKSKR